MQEPNIAPTKKRALAEKSLFIFPSVFHADFELIGFAGA